MKDLQLLNLYIKYFVHKYAKQGSSSWICSFEEFKSRPSYYKKRTENFFIREDGHIYTSETKEYGSFAYRDFYVGWGGDPSDRYWQSDIKNLYNESLPNFKDDTVKYTRLHAKDELNDKLKANQDYREPYVKLYTIL